MAPSPDRGYWQAPDASALGTDKVKVYQCDDIDICQGGGDGGGTT